MSLTEKDIRYRTSQKGVAHWNNLGDPYFLSAQQLSDGKAMRAAMTPRDWAYQQVCVQLETYGDDSKACTMAQMVEAGKYNWTSWIKNPTELPTPDEQMFYQYYHMEELIKELLEKGLVEEVPSKLTP